MKYTISINQFAIREAGFDFDLIDAAIFEVLRDYAHSNACRKMQDDEKPFFNVPYKVIIEELPLAKINKPDSVYRRFQKLEQYGIIEMHPDNKRLKQVWFSWGRNYDRMLFRTKTGFKSDQTDFDPAQTGFKSVLRPDLNPPHHTTIPFNHPPTGESTPAPEKTESLKAEVQKIPPGAGAQRANTSDEAETMIRTWANGDGRATVKNWISETTFSERTNGKVRDEITKFVGYYAVSKEPGMSHNFFSDPVKFFQNRFKAWLVRAKEINRQPAAAPASLPAETPYRQIKPDRY